MSGRKPSLDDYDNSKTEILSNLIDESSTHTSSDVGEGSLYSRMLEQFQKEKSSNENKSIRNKR